MVDESHADLIALELHRSGELGGEDAASLGVHLAGCARCRGLARGLEVAAVELAAPRPPIPDAIEAAIAAEGRAAARRGRRRVIAVRVARWAIPAVAAAAALVVAVPWRPHEPVPVAAALDVNGDGAVDVLDALTVARALERGDGDPAWDINGDAQTDRRDAEAIAVAAVSLGAQR